MLDIFKKEEIKSLNDRISELDEKNRKLSLQLGKRDEKTRKAVASKQVAERELNECEQRLRSLVKEVDDLRKEKESGVSFRFSGTLFGKRLDEVLSILGSIEARSASLITIYLADGDKLENAAKDVVSEIDGSAFSLIEKIDSSTGKAVFYDTNGIVRLVLIPVFPIRHSEAFAGMKFDLGLIGKSPTFEKILVLDTHAGETFIGIVETGGFLEHQIVRSSVMGKHSKGGWSQKRFGKLIEEDLRHHAGKVRDSLACMLKKHGDIEYVIAGGDGRLASMVLEGCNYPVIMKSMSPVAKGNVDQVMRDVMAVRWYGV
ncbi:MAG: Vms1/Ankzf1 family peptidyl-tRNA hydrolase [Candidatus Methanoperedens sp.]|nr:Vms1/Ankzf1 family peptidyl-tRNA hydrolase [Candidatus Methanoperedens sp.]